MIKVKVRKGDKVKIVAGSEKGKAGEVIEMDRKRLKIRVQGVRVQTHYDKKERTSVKKEGFIDYSNVKLQEKGKGDPNKMKPKKTKKA